MVTPNQKRVAVLALVDEFGVSQCRACLVVGQYRSTQRHEHVRSPQEAFLRQRIRALAVKYPRCGYRRVHVMLIRDGFAVNRKLVERQTGSKTEKGKWRESNGQQAIEN
jgi:putative transposase